MLRVSIPGVPIPNHFGIVQSAWSTQAEVDVTDTAIIFNTLLVPYMNRIYRKKMVRNHFDTLFPPFLFWLDRQVGRRDNQKIATVES
jgi:hypothetical protein